MMQSDPQAVLAKAKDDPNLAPILSDLLKILGEHFNAVAAEQGESIKSPSPPRLLRNVLHYRASSCPQGVATSIYCRGFEAKSGFTPILF
jgi:hypothetical protein